MLSQQSHDDPLGNDPTLGQITYYANGSSLNRQDCDQRFSSRADYRIWSKTFGNREGNGARTLDASELELARKGLSDGNPTVVWGLLSVLPALFCKQDYEEGTLAEGMQAVVTSCAERLSQNPKFIVGGEKTCRFLRFAALGNIQMFRWNANTSPITCREAFASLDALEQAFKQFDNKFEPGAGFRFGPVMDDSIQVIPPGLLNQSVRRMAGILSHHAFKAGQTAIATNQLTSETDALLKRAAMVAISAWRFYRYLRRGEATRSYQRGDDVPQAKELELLDTEIQALKVATQAAWDAGDYLRFPALAHHLLWSVTDRDKYWKFAKNFSKWIHQLGLEIPPLFQFEGEAGRPRAIGCFFTEGPYWWRIKRDQDREQDWKVVLESFLQWEAHLPPGNGMGLDPRRLDPFGLFKSLSHAVGDGLYHDAIVARSAYRLALKYHWTGLAEKLLGGFQPAKEELVDFAHHLKRIQQAMPFGLDREEDQHPAWIGVLKRAWSGLDPKDKLSVEELLNVHEVLLGRTVQLIRGKGARSAPAFSRKLSGLASEEEIRQECLNNDATTLPGLATVSAEKVGDLMRAVSDRELGRPVCVSIVEIVPDKFSFLAVGVDARQRICWRPDIKEFKGLTGEIKALRDTREHWFEHTDPIPDEPPMAWDDQCRQLCGFLAALTHSINRDCRWLMLAVEPHMAGLPWQDLIRRFWPARNPVLVTLIPNFGWAADSYKDLHKYPKTPLNWFDLSPNAEFKDLNKQIQADVKDRPQRISSTFIALGHGNESDGITTIEAYSGELGPNHWSNLGEYRSLLIHACSGGTSTRSFLGDLDGLPARCLSTGCRLVCAPVAKIPLRAAEKLHEWHGDSRQPNSFGWRYLQAMAADPWVGIYTCYGFGNQYVVAPQAADGGSYRDEWIEY
jgi:hypothetical protein